MGIRGNYEDVGPAASLVNVDSSRFLGTTHDHRSLSLTRNPGASAVVAILVVLALTTCATSLVNLFTSAGEFGIRFGGSTGAIRDVTPGSPAQRAGLRAGDVILEHPTDARSYALALGLIQPVSGNRIRVSVSRGLNEQTVEVTAAPMSAKTEFAFSVLLAILVSLVMLAVATALVILRPSWMTWSFFAFSFGAPTAMLPPGSPTFVVPLWTMYLTLCVAASVSGMLIFLACFPEDDAWNTWRVWIVRLAVIAGLVLVIALPNGIPAASTFHGIQAIGAGGDRTAEISIAILYFLGVVTFGSAYLQSDPRDRQRLGWVAAAIAISMVGLVPSVFSHSADTPAAQYLLAALANAILLPMPIAIAYAVLHHRVIPVHFAISRALVYTILSAMVVALFAAADWLVGSVLSTAQWALPIEFVAAIAMGFWLNSAHHRVNRLVDQRLYRRRYEGMQRLAQVVAGLRDAETFTEVDMALAREAVDNLELTSAAVFRRSDDGIFVRRAATGWPQDALGAIPRDSRLCLHVRGKASALRLKAITCDVALPDGEAAPLLAMPILLRHRLEAIALYGGHRNGGDLDVDKLEALERLARGCENAYDSLTAQKAEETIAALRAQLTAFQA